MNSRTPEQIMKDCIDWRTPYCRMCPCEQCNDRVEPYLPKPCEGTKEDQDD